jgi:DNA-binding NarL/FixJ family response regulator
MTETNISILVADDSPFIRTAYQRILETQENFNVVSIVENGLQPVEKALELTSNVIVIDIRMPELDGISASHKIRKSLPETFIVVVPAYDDLSYVFDLIQKTLMAKLICLKILWMT